MASTVKLKNNNDDKHEGVVGFSWTIFFFGSFVPLFRGDWCWFIIMLIADLCTFSLAKFIFCFTYNKSYIKNLLDKGYFPADDHSRQLLIQAGLILDSETQSSEPTVTVTPVSTSTGSTKCKQRGNGGRFTMTFKFTTKIDRLLWAILGISGCALALWNAWQIYLWLDFVSF